MILTHLRREVLQRCSLNRVNGELVVGVDGSESARDCVAMSAKNANRDQGPGSPNHFFDAFPESIISTTPGRRGSMDGTWLARIPMSPVAAGTLTWTTSAEVKIA